MYVYINWFDFSAKLILLRIYPHDIAVTVNLVFSNFNFINHIVGKVYIRKIE
jgi:hypothetical protein